MAKKTYEVSIVITELVDGEATDNAHDITFEMKLNDKLHPATTLRDAIAFGAKEEGIELC